jgi:hypothetical protein
MNGLIAITHNKTPQLGFTGYSIFNLKGTQQSISINGGTYNDVYEVSIDSTLINISNTQSTIPWKIDYSESKGLVRYYMINGQAWSKL